MIQILEYIVQNYTLLLSVLVLILLAIIGYYADKTNFGQGNKEKETEDIVEELKEIDNAIVEPKEQNVVENIGQITKEEDKKDTINQNIIESAQQETKFDSDFEKEETIIKKELIQKDEQSKEFEEIDSLLPKRELINSDLLTEIEGMELNSLKEKTSFDVPDLDDISLPKIKNLVEKEQDIWKF